VIKRWRPITVVAAAVATTVAAALAVSTPGVASAASTPGWRFVALFPAGDAGADVVSASRFGHQWAVGADLKDLGAEARSAEGWKQSTPALNPKPDEGISAVSVAATSGQQAWAFAGLIGRVNGRVVGVHNNGTTWSAPLSFAGETALSTAIATGPGDVWQ